MNRKGKREIAEVPLGKMLRWHAISLRFERRTMKMLISKYNDRLPLIGSEITGLACC